MLADPQAQFKSFPQQQYRLLAFIRRMHLDVLLLVCSRTKRAGTLNPMRQQLRCLLSPVSQSGVESVRVSAKKQEDNIEVHASYKREMSVID